MTDLRSTRLLAGSVLAFSFLASGCGAGSAASASSTPTPTPTSTGTPLPTPTPTSAPDPIVLSGVTETDGAGGSSPVPGASLSVFRNGNPTALISGTSDATTGAYSLNVPTGGISVDGYVHVTKSGYLDSYIYPHTPWAANSAHSFTLLDSSTFGLLAGLAGVTQSNTNGWVAVEVDDANGTPSAGATVSASPSGTVKYLAGGIPSSSATMTDADGVAFIFNLPAGDVQISAMVGATSLNAHAVNARAAVLTYTAIRP